MFFGLFGFSLASIVVRAWLILIPIACVLGSFFANHGGVVLALRHVSGDGRNPGCIFCFVAAESGYLLVFSCCSWEENDRQRLSENEILRHPIKGRFCFGLNVHKKNTKKYNLKRIKT